MFPYYDVKWTLWTMQPLIDVMSTRSTMMKDFSSRICLSMKRHSMYVPTLWIMNVTPLRWTCVCCGLMHDKVIGPFIFAEQTMTSNNSLNMLQLYAVPQFPECVISQEDGTPPHYANIVCQFLDRAFPERWIDGASDDPQIWCHYIYFEGLFEAACVQWVYQQHWPFKTEPQTPLTLLHQMSLSVVGRTWLPFRCVANGAYIGLL